MTSIQLTAPLIDYELTAQERPTHGTLTVFTEEVNWVSDNADQLVTDTGDVLIFKSYNGDGYPIALTAPIIDYEMTAQDRPTNGVSTTFTDTDNWVSDNSDQLVTDSGDTLVFNSVSGTGYPIALTAPLIDYELTAQERP